MRRSWARPLLRVTSFSLIKSTFNSLINCLNPIIMVHSPKIRKVIFFEKMTTLVMILGAERDVTSEKS